MGIQNNKLNHTYINFDNVDEAEEFAIMLLKSVGANEALTSP